MPVRRCSVFHSLPAAWMLCLCLIVSAMPSGAAASGQPEKTDGIVLASGAGYKKLVNALAEIFTLQTGIKVDLVYGNMARVTALARQSGQVDVVLGDSTYLHGAELDFTRRHTLGHGRLVLAAAPGKTADSAAVLDNPGATRIALPDSAKAIYGIAAREFLLSTGRLPDIAPRLIEVATVPQVFSYLAAGEVDYGFMNLTHALNVADKLGGYVVLDETAHTPVLIMAGVLRAAPSAEQAAAFMGFLESPQARAVITANGL